MTGIFRPGLKYFKNMVWGVKLLLKLDILIAVSVWQIFFSCDIFLLVWQTFVCDSFSCTFIDFHFVWQIFSWSDGLWGIAKLTIWVQLSCLQRKPPFHFSTGYRHMHIFLVCVYVVTTYMWLCLKLVYLSKSIIFIFLMQYIYKTLVACKQYISVIRQAHFRYAFYPFWWCVGLNRLHSRINVPNVNITCREGELQSCM